MDGEESNELEHTLPGIPSAPQKASQEIPKAIGPYKIESLLDSGGMSLLYLGSKDGGKESVAIKVLSSKFANHKDARRRFIHEGEIISLADHPNIVKFLSQGEWENGLYLAMEFVQGVSLRKFIQHTPLSLRKALEVVLQIAYAVCHMHTHGIIHCDLKPENILVTEEGVVKLIDFGIAHRMAEEVFDTKELRQFVGTPSYMSPEQRDDASIVSYPSDIYSLGIIAYELVLGKLSHGHVHLGLMPAGLQKILMHALQPDSKERYQDMVDFITDVSNYLNVILESPGKEEKGPLPQALENLQETLLVLTKEKHIDWQGCDVNVVFHKGVGLF